MAKDLKFNLQLFADAGTVVNTTQEVVNAYTGEATPFDEKHSLSVGNKVFYDTALMVNARDRLIYEQFAEVQEIPANHGKTVEFRKFDLIDPPDRLHEGVIPDGKRFGETAVTATVTEWGEFVALSEDVKFNQIDDVALGAMEEIGASMGKKMDSLTRDALLAQATNIIIPPNVDETGKITKKPRVPYEIDASNRMTADTVHRVATQLMVAKGEPIDGAYIGIVHPVVAYDLTRDPEWIDYHKYASPDEIYNGEIGKLRGVRFMVTTNAPVMAGKTLHSESKRYLTVASGAAATAGTPITNGYGVTGAYAITVSETLNGADVTADYKALIGQFVLIYSGDAIANCVTVCGVDVSAKKIYIEETGVTVSSGNTLVPGNGGDEGANSTEQLAVFGSVFLSKGVFKRIKVAGGDMRTIIKSAAEAGGPLEQFSTVGAKGKHGVKVLYPDRMVVVYSASEYSNITEPNWEL